MASVELTWADTASSEDGFRVYRSTTAAPSFPGDYTQIGSLAADTTTYTDSNAPVEQTVTYAVTTYNAAGESPPTTASVNTLPKRNAVVSASDTGVAATTSAQARVMSTSASDTGVAATTSARTQAPSVSASDTGVSITTPIRFTAVSGTVSKNGSAVDGATVIAVDLTTEQLVAVTGTATDGTYTLPEVRSGTTLSVSVDYDDDGSDFGRQKTLDVQG